MGPSYNASTYGDRIAAVYDDMPRTPKNTDVAVEFLATLAGRGPLLELGIGTGRVALPLARKGFDVRGIDASSAMVEKLRTKPGGDCIPVVMGDFADMPVDGTYTLIFVVFNTFFGILSQDDQVRCFAGIAQRLTEDGCFVMEAFVPDLTRFDRGQRVEAVAVATDMVDLEASVHDRALQQVRAHHILISAHGVQLYPVQLRYAWPSELDLMARLAGLRLRERWSSWDRQPFTASSTSHVSVYERAR
jgi:SAM-dependent methyltransferase